MTQPRIRHDWHLSQELRRQVDFNADGRFIQMVEGLPKTPTEKVQKKALRDEGLTDDTWDREAQG